MAGTSRRSGASRRQPPVEPAQVLRACLAGWIALALYLFLVPNPERLTADVDPSFGHLVVFAALGSTATALFEPGPRRLLAVFAAGLAGGAAIEVAQELGPSGRAFDLHDIGWDGVGLVVGIAVVAAAHRLLGRPRLTAAVVAVGSLTSLVAVALGAATAR